MHRRGLPTEALAGPGVGAGGIYVDGTWAGGGHAGAFPDGLGAAGGGGIRLVSGVASAQLEDSSRGFSFSKDGPLDMGMNPQAGESASEWIARAAEREIADVLWKFGHERISRRIARRIV